MSTAALDLQIPPGASEIGISELRAFVSLKPSKRVGKNLPSDLRDLFLKLVDQGDKLLLHALDSRSATEFESRRAEVIGTYVRVQEATGVLANAIIPKILLDSVLEDAFVSLEAEFEAETPQRYGVTAKEQAVFTTWTIRRTMVLLEKINDAGPPAGSSRAADKEMASSFSQHLWWTFFHLDCLRAGIKYDKPLRSEVVNKLVDGLRAAVNAYALARQGLNLRRQPEFPSPIDSRLQWDAEDQSLLDESMSDLDLIPITEDDGY